MVGELAPAIDLWSASCVRGRVNVLREISLKILPGELVFITGVSGAGKSTLLGLIHGDLELASGEAYVGGHVLHERRQLDLPRLRREVGIVYQDYRLLPRLTALENVVFAVRACELRLDPLEALRRARAHLDTVGLAGRCSHYPSELSGGEQQRVAIARTLATRPRVLLADEPTGNLDQANSSHVTDLLAQIARAGTAVLIATHDPKLVLDGTGQHVQLEKGTLERPAVAARTG